MEQQTFRSRLVELIQKSRKAMRLYSTIGKSGTRPGGDFADYQAHEWREVNAELVRRLGAALETPDHRRLVANVCVLRDQLNSEFRSAEGEMRTRQRELIVAAEHSDFIRAGNLSRELVLLKARTQASQAAHHELEVVLKRSKVSEGLQSEDSAPIELSSEQVVPPKEESTSKPRDAAPQVAKVIPLRKII